jgi:predicted secreted protein
MTEAIIVKKGESVKISLDSNLTTGFSWTAEFDPQFLSLFNKEFARSSNLIGASGIETFEFKTLKSGQTMLRMIYKRQFDKENNKQRIFTLKIT